MVLIAGQVVLRDQPGAQDDLPEHERAGHGCQRQEDVGGRRRPGSARRHAPFRDHRAARDLPSDDHCVLYIARDVEYPRHRSSSRDRTANAVRGRAAPRTPRDPLLYRGRPARREPASGVLEPAAAARGRASRPRALRGRRRPADHVAPPLFRPARTARPRTHPPHLDRAAPGSVSRAHRTRDRAPRNRRNRRAVRRDARRRLGRCDCPDDRADADPRPFPRSQRQPHRRLLDGAAAGSGRRGSSGGAARAPLRRQLARRPRRVRRARDRRGRALAAAGRTGADGGSPRAVVRLSQPCPLVVARGVLRPAVNGVLLRPHLAAVDPPARGLLEGGFRIAPGARERGPGRPGNARSRRREPPSQPEADAARGRRVHGGGVPRPPPRAGSRRGLDDRHRPGPGWLRSGWG